MVVYTVLTGGHDKLQTALFHNKAKYICFSDQPITAGGWEYRHLDKKFEDTRRNSRRPKIRPDVFLSDHKISLYHDANFQLLEDPIVLCEKWLSEVNLALFHHPERNCLYEEAKVCRSMKLDAAIKFDRQVERYKAEKMPPRWGLFHAAVILRRHLEPDVLKLSSLWWDEYTENSCRDQISLPYAMWKTGINYSVVPGKPYSCSSFAYTSHGR